MNDLIYALATPVGGAIAVVRLSGTGAKKLLYTVFTGRGAPREMAYGRIVNEAGEPLDQAMAAFFPAPRSYTGEDMAELYLHGGQTTVRRVLALLGRHARGARPGEFTERAFLNGKLDLAQAEAVMDLINAGAERSANSALAQLTGRLSERIAAVEAQLLDALSGLEAAIDYPEELEDDVTSALPGVLAAAEAELAALIGAGLSGRVLREGARVALIGRPNAGKSSLLNALAGAERAIVTQFAGTTRDVLEEAVSMDGIPVTLFDTAGIRAADDPVERIGVERARRAAERADLLLLCFDAAAPLSEEDEALLAETAGRSRLAVCCKGDLPALWEAEALSPYGIEALAVSAETGEGLAALRRAIAASIAPAAESALVTNARHIEALQRAAASVSDAEKSAGGTEPELVATDLREALAALGQITGREASADLIERIFSKFCVGK
ncbi:MAG: tRNA uridine-5-carboxymethylaminomethyl(34) synthesis GTPase MnmE [Christensenellaceae bacterium]|nr:tRNA uridine-5-carboxymethylaminomethyl(34) synthesis GTPase MnmE [Christensenellaceae bacterium]